MFFGAPSTFVCTDESDGVMIRMYIVKCTLYIVRTDMNDDDAFHADHDDDEDSFSFSFSFIGFFSAMVKRPGLNRDQAKTVKAVSGECRSNRTIPRTLS